MATLLTNINSVRSELGLPTTTSVVGSADPAINQLYALMNRIGNYIFTEKNPQGLAKEHRFQTVFYTYTGDTTSGSTTISNLSSVVGLSTDFGVQGTGIEQDSQILSVGVDSAVMSVPASLTATGTTFTFGQISYDMPSDYGRMTEKTQYNKDTKWAIHGEKSAQEWQWLKSSWTSTVSTGVNQKFRIMNDKFAVFPMPISVETYGFEYTSNGWALSSGGTAQTTFLADDDTSIFPDDILVTGTKLKYFEIKGFDNTALLADFKDLLSKWKASEAGADTLQLAPLRLYPYLSDKNIPESGFGS